MSLLGKRYKIELKGIDLVFLESVLLEQTDKAFKKKDLDRFNNLQQLRAAIETYKEELK